MIVYDSYIYNISILSSDPSCGQIVGTWDSQPLGQHRRSRVQVAPNALHHLFFIPRACESCCSNQRQNGENHSGSFWYILETLGIP